MKQSLNKSRSKGVGLIEILVALLVLGIGVMGYAGLQLAAIKNADDAHNLVRATIIAQDAIERVMVNPPQQNAYFNVSNWPDGAIAPREAPNNWLRCISNNCSAAQVRDWDIAQLRWMAANQLIDGRILGRDCGGGVGCISVSWGGFPVADCVENNGDINTSRPVNGVEPKCVVIEVAR